MEEAEGELESLARLGTRSWINMQMKGFKAGEQAQPVDVQLYTLLRKLELLAEDTEADMQSTSVSLVRAMPRAVVDLATLQDAAAELREATAGLADELRALEMQSTASLGLLVEVRARLACCRSLRTARWCACYRVRSRPLRAQPSRSVIVLHTRARALPRRRST